MQLKVRGSFDQLPDARPPELCLVTAQDLLLRRLVLVWRAIYI